MALVETVIGQVIRGLDEKTILDAEEDAPFRADRPWDCHTSPTIPEKADISRMDRILGSYTMMQQGPGVIRFYTKNLTRYVASLLKWSRITKIESPQPSIAAELVVRATYEHEKIHCLCDVWRNLTNKESHGDHIPLMEEALATAFEWHSLSTGSLSALAGNLPLLKLRLFDGLSSGYRDYREYEDIRRFERNVMAYLTGGKVLTQLVSGRVGFDFGPWALSRLLDPANPAWKEEEA